MRQLLPAATTLLLACSGPQPPTGTAATGTAATAATASASPCEWAISDGLEVTWGDQVFGTDGDGIQFVDVDGAGAIDAVLFLGGCGNHADCEYAVVVACDAGGYRAVWGPEYAQFVAVEPQPSGWGRLIVTERLGEMGCDWPQEVSHEFRDGEWRDVGSCAPGFDRSQWRDECGDGPAEVCE